MARILVTEEIAEGGLDRLRAAGHEVDVRNGLSADELLTVDPGRPRPDHPLRDDRHRRRADRRRRPARRRAGRHRPRQRRRRGGDAPRRDGRQRAAEQHRLGRRAHDGAAAGPGPQRAAGPRRARRRTLGAQQVGGRRARRQDARHRRPRPHRQARRRPGPRLRHAPHRRTTRSCRPSVAASSASSCCRSTRSSPSPTSSRSTCRRRPRRRASSARDLLLKAKPSLRVINVARGGIVDEAALADAVREGIIAGAALDVFEAEPTTVSPLFELESIVVTPHLGASTREAQDKAGDTIADMVQLALAGEFVPFAVNLAAAEAHDDLRPFLPAGRAPRAPVRLARRRAAVDGGDHGRGRDRRLRHAHRRASPC